MTLVKFNNKPWNNLDWLESFFDSDRLDSSVHRGLPAVNIRENDNGFHIEVSAPGFEKDDFNLEIENEMLKITAETKVEKDHDEDRYTLREFGYTNFQRMFSLPESVDSNKIEASYKNGILHIEVPKKDEAKPKPAQRIRIK